MKRMTAASVALAALTPGAALSAQDTEWNRYTLDELGGVYVSADAEQACTSGDWDASSLVTDAEATLTESEVPVLTHEAMLETPGHPELRITVACVSDEGSGSVGYSLSVRLMQAAQLIRDPQISLPEAVTWFANSVGVVDASEVEPAVQGALETTITAFATAFVAANTEEEPTG